MSLLDELYEDFVIIDKTTAPDSYGGVITTWVEGATVKAIASLNTSTGAQIAQALTAINTYTITTQKKIIFRFDDVVKRVSDGKYFRITSDGDDNKTPPSAELNMRQCQAVQWTLPDDEDESGENDG